MWAVSLPPICFWHAKKDIIYAWIVHRWIDFRELAQPVWFWFLCLLTQPSSYEFFIRRDTFILVFWNFFGDQHIALKSYNNFHTTTFVLKRLLVNLIQPRRVTHRWKSLVDWSFRDFSRGNNNKTLLFKINSSDYQVVITFSFKVHQNHIKIK